MRPDSISRYPFDSVVDSVCERGADVAELKALCRHDLLGKRVLNVTAHGDFSLQNLVFDPRTIKLTGVVDWDLAEQQGWPFRDLMHLLVAWQYETTGATANEAALTVLERLRDASGLEHQLTRKYLTAMRVEPEQIVWSIQQYLLRNIHDKYQYGDKKIAPLLERLSAQLATARLLTKEWLEVSPSPQQHVHLNDFGRSES